MTDRPRVWTLVDFGDQIRAVGPSLARPNHADAIEWDREKVVPVIANVLRTYGSQREAEAIFDALDREQT